MTIQQTIDIPASRKVHFDVVLPETVPCGRTNVILDFPFTPAPENTAEDQRAIDPRLIGAVNPAIFGKGKIVGDIIGPFHDEWENGY